MSATAQDAPGRPFWSTGTREPKQFEIAYTIGATGALTTLLTQTDTAITLTRTGVGTYNLTFPLTPGLAKIAAYVFSPAPTVSSAILTALNDVAGTATLRTIGFGAATAVELAVSDRLHVVVEADSRGDS